MRANHDLAGNSEGGKGGYAALADAVTPMASAGAIAPVIVLTVDKDVYVEGTDSGS